MSEPIKYIIIFSCLIILAICIFSFSYSLAKKNSIKKMYLEIEHLLESLIPASKKEEFIFKKVYSDAYDYVFETPNYMYYIKVVPNMSNQEICVNNAVKWQLRKTFNDESMHFVEHIEGLMRMDFEASSKEIKKLYIIYPNARSLLKYINECEMVFIHPDTDVYGTNIIPYVALTENPELLKIKKEI